jgi:hypothetical protein
MMLQVDGSDHDWLEGRGPRLCLIGAIDDAGGKVPGAFLLRPKVLGVTSGCFPRSSNDRACRSRSIVIVTRSSGLTESPPLMSSSSINALLPTWAEPWTNLTLILAGWPQAKGRIERLWGTFQDRLVSELRLAKAKTLEQAQAVLDRYLPEHNRKFSNPAQAQPAWRKASAQQIEQALCFKESVRWPTIIPSPSMACS